MSDKFTINVLGKELEILPQDETDQVTYVVQEGNNFLTVVGLNEHAAWEATTDIDLALVEAIGNEIEHALM